MDEDDQNTETMGIHMPEFDDKGNLVKSRIEIYSAPYVPEGADNLTRLLARHQFEAVALYEVAHRIHHELTYIDMLNWEHVTERDKTEVTWYVGYMRERSEIIGNMEDFSEIFQMAVLNPGYLYILSHDRFNYNGKFNR